MTRYGHCIVSMFVGSKANLNMVWLWKEQVSGAEEGLYLGATDLNLEHLVHFNNKVISTYQIKTTNVLKHVQAGLSTLVSFQMCIH